MRSPKNGKNVPLDSPRLPQPRTVNWTGGGRWGGWGGGGGSSRVSAVSLASQGADGSAAAGLGDDTTRGPRSSLGL